jgi:probable rRNA maturation factor
VTAPVAARELARIAARALSAAGAASPASIALILSDDIELAALNSEHMGETGPTDVLSFPLLPADAYPDHTGKGAGLASRRSLGPRIFTPPGRRPHLGDIVMSVERAIANAQRGMGGQTSDMRSSGADELRLLVAHGVLHICGWDHAERAERDAMRALEMRILNEA